MPASIYCDWSLDELVLTLSTAHSLHLCSALSVRCDLAIGSASVHLQTDGRLLEGVRCLVGQPPSPSPSHPAHLVKLKG
ncbi:unnamed protein product [Nippostrongylus brasiliensis]|uniref:Uncharacterized protein n=1 Tax=Nippostrongylus brasiliensis TaxID=27835 RepID=A0A0N4Y670_NIPBR|nr:unnamed protein product [Nippostrongylus brasiliensis]